MSGWRTIDTPCPLCGARPGVGCRTRGDVPTALHAARAKAAYQEHGVRHPSYNPTGKNTNAS